MRFKYGLLLLGFLVYGSAMTASAAGWFDSLKQAGKMSVYGGLQGGIDSLQVQRDVSILTVVGSGSSVHTTASYEDGANGGVIGGFLGLQYRLRHNISLAVEGDANYDDAETNLSVINPNGASGSVTLSEQVKHGYGISFIPSIVLSQLMRTAAHVAAFARIGYTRGNFDVTNSLKAAPTSDQGFTGDVSEGVNGLTLGLGVNIPLHHHFSARFEYDYTAYASFSKTTSVFDPKGSVTRTFDTHFHPRTNEVLLGVYYKIPLSTF